MAESQALSDDIGFLLSRVGGMVLGAVNKALVPTGLRVRSYSVLVLACEQAEGVNQRGVAATMGLDPSQIVGLVDELEERGLVVRTLDPSDRRNKLIAATDEDAGSATTPRHVSTRPTDATSRASPTRW